MDFHSLARRELQALCKKNKIPANLTNVAMADALQALEKVEGLNELENSQQYPEKITEVEPRTALRTSTRKKPVKVEPESSQILTRSRRTTRRTATEDCENETKNFGSQGTPAPTNHGNAIAASTRRKIDSQLIECGEVEKKNVQEKREVPKTPAVYTRRKVETQKDEKSVKKVYSTRHSVRLLEKTMEELSLKEESKIVAVKFEGLCDTTVEVEQPKDEYGTPDDENTNDCGVDQFPDKECETKHMINDDNIFDECEVESATKQMRDQFLESKSETNAEHVADCEKENDAAIIHCQMELESEKCAYLSEIEVNGDTESMDKFVGAENLEQAIDMIPESKDTFVKAENLEKEIDEIPESIDDNDSMDTFVEAEYSEKPIELIRESIDDGGEQNTENPEKNMSSVMESEAESELIDNAFESDSLSLMKTEDNLIEDASEVSSLVTVEEPIEDASENSEMKEEKTEGVNAIDVLNSNGGINTEAMEKKKTETSWSPFAGDTIQGQFPRPTNEAKKLPTTEIDCMDKENVEMEREVNNAKASYTDMSLRQLTKALREKLQIKNEEVSKARIALQENAAEPL